MYKWIIGGVVVLAILALVVFGNNSGDPAMNFFGTHKVGPLEQKARELSFAMEDHHRELAEHRKSVAKPVPCAIAVEGAFDPATGRNAYWYYQWPDGKLECFDSGGFHPVTGVKLEEMTKDQVAVIINHPDKYPATDILWHPQSHQQAASSPSAPAPATAATPLPVLGEGHCCDRQ